MGTRAGAAPTAATTLDRKATPIMCWLANKGRAMTATILINRFEDPRWRRFDRRLYYAETKT